MASVKRVRDGDGLDEPWIQFTIPVPEELKRAVKLHSINRDGSMQAFIVAALRERLRIPHVSSSQTRTRARQTART